MADETNRINVSRDALRADLAEMELRLRTWIDQQLSTKADISALTSIKKDISEIKQQSVMRDGPLMRDIRDYEVSMRHFSEGNFNEAQKRSLKILMDQNLKDHTNSGWTMRQRYMAVMALMVSIVAILSSVYLTVHYAT